jgi:Trypsin
MPQRLLPLLLPFTLLATLGAAASAFAVAGGETVDIATVPFTASTTNCTGTLIAPDRLLTAAHCVEEVDPDGGYVVVGADAHDVFKVPETSKYPVKGYSSAPGFRLAFPFAHKNPRNATAVNDVAIVLLAKPVTGIAPVAIAGPGDTALEQAGRPVYMLGYGALAARTPARRPVADQPATVPAILRTRRRDDGRLRPGPRRRPAHPAVRR